MISNRSEVFAAIETERSYQKERWGSEGEKHSNLEYLVYIRDYVEEALHRLSRVSDAECVYPTQDSLRKIAALAVAAQEVNGVRVRGAR